MDVKTISAILFLGVGLSTSPVFATELTFEEAFDKPFYKNDTVIYGSIATVSAAAIAFTTMTAGTGAPAAAAGVGSFATWVGGGSSGAYMAGLSTVGGWMGGNAVVGAAMLNAISAAALGGATMKGLGMTATLGLKLLTAGELGVVSIDVSDSLNTDIDNIIYIIPTPISDELGSSETQDVINTLSRVSEHFEAGAIKETTYIQALTNINEKALSIVKNAQKKEDIVSAALLLNTIGNKDAFVETILNLEIDLLGESFLYYLKAAAYFMKGNSVSAENYARMAIEAEPEVIESYMLLAMILSEQGQYSKIKTIIEPHLEYFEPGHYKSINNLISAYNLLGDIAQANGHFDDAVMFYMQSVDEIGLLANDDDKKALLLNKISRSYFYAGDNKEADNYFNMALDEAETDNVVQLLYDEHNSRI